MMKSNQLGSSKYFTREEAGETLGGDWNPNAPREARDTYTFNSKAKYTGEWKGGFRDGTGE